MLLNLSAFIRLIRNVVAAALCACAAVGSVSGQAPLVQDSVVASDAGELVRVQWKLSAADRALASGLSGVAEDLYRGLLGDSGLSLERVAEVRVRLAAALIAQRRFTAAAVVLREVAELERGDTYYLYLAVSAYGNGRSVDQGVFSQALDRVSVDGLLREELPWFYVLRGLRAELLEDFEVSGRFFEKAKSAAVSPEQRAFFEGLLLRDDVLNTPASDALLAKLREQLELFKGTRAAYPYVCESAIVLYRLGQQDAAIKLLRAELANAAAGYNARERGQFALLEGVIMGVDTIRGRDRLRELVRNGKSREVMSIALQLLARNTQERAELSDFLNEMILRSKGHPLLGQMYYLRSQLALADGSEESIVVAEADARVLLEQFPGHREITNVYRLLAYAALQRTPAQYRAAADFLIQLRDQSVAPERLLELNRLIGDCYFMNGDYANAVDFYKAVRGGGAEADGAVFLRLITAEVRAGQIDAALVHIDQADFSGNIRVVDRWRAEWNVAQALQGNGQLQVALERVRLLLADSASGSVPTSLDLRLRWLEARLSVMAGELEGVQARVDVLLGRIDSIPEGTLNPAEARLLKTEVLLLQADVLIRSGDSSAGMEVLGRLRDGFAQSSAAERSYLTEANYYASVGDFELAQKTLTELASIYGDSVLAPQALFEAALYCERRGADYFAEAVRVHHDLTQRYPSDPLVFAAQLKQGDLLRQMNDFAGAQIIYENLIRSFPGHPRRYVAELSRADCMLALARDDAAQLTDVALTLERLIDLPHLPIDFQAEVGYKWGFALMQRGARDEAQEVFALISGRFLLDGENATGLGATGRYWMSRTLLELGALLEESGELAAARRVYRKMVAYNLPGRNLAQSRAADLAVVEE